MITPAVAIEPDAAVIEADAQSLYEEVAHAQGIREIWADVPMTHKAIFRAIARDPYVWGRT
jgi:hypothetical protein